jgi:hypothetical protein
MFMSLHENERQNRVTKISDKLLGNFATFLGKEVTNAIKFLSCSLENSVIFSFSQFEIFCLPAVKI